jgi:hypothetical protein
MVTGSSSSTDLNLQASAASEDYSVLPSKRFVREARHTSGGEKVGPEGQTISLGGGFRVTAQSQCQHQGRGVNGLGVMNSGQLHSHRSPKWSVTRLNR